MKQFGEFFIALDQIGFPLIRKKNWDFFISLFPVSIYQFRRCFDFNFDPAAPDQLWKEFVRGVDQQQLDHYITFLAREDTDFFKGTHKLPTQEQWNLLFESSAEIQNIKPRLENFCADEPVAEPAKKWISAGDFPLTSDGILEMIQNDVQGKSWFQDTITCLGKPMNQLWSNTWDPKVIREVYGWHPKKIQYEEGQAVFFQPDFTDNQPQGRNLVGFRIVKEIPSLKDRIAKVLEEAENLPALNPGSMSQKAVFGAAGNFFNKPRFRYLRAKVTLREQAAERGFNQNSDLFFLGILLIEAINGFTMMSVYDLDPVFTQKTTSYSTSMIGSVSFNEKARQLIFRLLVKPDEVSPLELPDKIRSMLHSLE